MSATATCINDKHFNPFSSFRKALEVKDPVKIWGLHTKNKEHTCSSFQLAHSYLLADSMVGKKIEEHTMDPAL